MAKNKGLFKGKIGWSGGRSMVGVQFEDGSVCDIGEPCAGGSTGGPGGLVNSLNDLARSMGGRHGRLSDSDVAKVAKEHGDPNITVYEDGSWKNEVTGESGTLPGSIARRGDRS